MPDLERSRLLERLYVLSGGDTLRLVPVADLAAESGLTEDQLDAAMAHPGPIDAVVDSRASPHDSSTCLTDTA